MLSIKKITDVMPDRRQIIDGSRAFIAYKGHKPICWKCYSLLDKEQPQLIINRWAVCEKCYMKDVYERPWYHAEYREEY